MTLTTIITDFPQTQDSIWIGIEHRDRTAIAQRLQEFLDDTDVLYFKTRRFHWNITGPMFYSLHTLFEEQYKELAKAVDEIAERIRALGFLVPVSSTEFQRSPEATTGYDASTSEGMLTSLVESHEAISRQAKSIFKLTNGSGDEVTSDLLVQRMKIHEHYAWVLRSHL